MIVGTFFPHVTVVPLRTLGLLETRKSEESDTHERERKREEGTFQKR